MPARTDHTYSAPGIGTRKTNTYNTRPRKPKKAPPHVSVPYAPTARGKAAEVAARGHVTVPYAPTPTGKAAEHAAVIKAARKKQRHAERALHHILSAQPPSPVQAVENAGLGIRPPQSKSWRRAYPEASKTANSLYVRHLRAHEGLKEDPLAEFAIDTAATMGLGAGAKLLGSAAKEGITAGLARIGAGVGGTDATVGEKAVEEGIKGLSKRVASSARGKVAQKVTDVRTAPARAASAVRSAPKDIREAAATSAGRRAAARGAARSAARHPLRTGYGAAAVSPVPLPYELDKRARALAKGTIDATWNHPGKVAETTAHGIEGAFTFPLALGGAAVSSAKHGSLEPLEEQIANTVYIPKSKTGTGRSGGLVGMASSLASGNPNTVEETTLQETGLTPFIPLPHLLRRARNSDQWAGLRGTARQYMENRRSATQDARIAAEKAATEAGDFVSSKKVKKIKPSIEDTSRPGEHYVSRTVGKLTERQRSRHRLAREVARMEEEQAMAGAIPVKQIVKAIKDSPGFSRKSEQNYGEALRIAGKYGLPKNEAKGIAFVRMLHDNWPKIEHGDVPAGVHLDRHSTKFILDHPEIFHDPHFWNALEKLNKLTKPISTSERHQYLAQVTNIINPLLKSKGEHQILLPEEMVTKEALKILPDRGKHGKPWSRSEALSYVKELREVTGPDAAKAHEIAESLTNRHHTGALDGLMKPPEHGGPEHGVSTTEAVAWTPEMEQAFVKAARHHGQRFGLKEPTPYLADVVPSGSKPAPLPDMGAHVPLRKIWPSQGIAAKSGNAESSLESVLTHSVAKPYARAATLRGLNRIFDYASRKVHGKRYLTLTELDHLANTHQLPHGVVPVRTEALRHLTAEHPVDPATAIMGEIEHGQQLLSSKEELAKQINQTKEMGTKGQKYALLDSTAINELAGHMKGLSGAEKGIGHVSNFITRSILNSVAFEASQFVQEGVPGAMALGRDVVYLPRALKAIRQISKLPPELQAEIRATVGSSFGLQGAPKLTDFRSAGFMDPIRAAGSKGFWRNVWEIVNGTKIHNFDRARAGRFREAAAIAKMEGDLRRASKGFGKFSHGAQNLFKTEQEAVAAMKGMNPAERMAYIAEHPRLGDKIQQSMQNMMGNFNSLTVFEKHFAPFAIFYPFQRYSVLFVLYHFPLDHPVVATALNLLGQVNAAELKRLAAKEGGEPAPLDYAKPVIDTGHGTRAVLPSGQRFAPSLSAIQQAVLEGKPMEATGALNPALQLAAEVAAGKKAYTEAPLEENRLAYAGRQIASFSPFSRFLGIPEVGTGKSSPLTDAIPPFKGKPHQHPASESFAELTPGASWNSAFIPFITQSGKNYTKAKNAEKNFRVKYGEGKIPGPFDSKMVTELLYGNNGKPKPKMLGEVLKKIHAQESAKNSVSKFEKPNLPKSKPFSPLQKELLEEVENAYQTGPNQKKKNPYLEAFEESTGGNPYLEALKPKKRGGNVYLEALGE